MDQGVFLSNSREDLLQLGFGFCLPPNIGSPP
jgi:hypothetical protein